MKRNHFHRKFLFLAFVMTIFSACLKTDDVIDPENRGTWKTYTTSNGLADNSVWSLFEDKDGIIWAGTLNNGVGKFDGQNWTNFNVSSGMADNSVIAIAQDKDGDMWFGTLGGLSILSGGEWINIPTLGGYSYQVSSIIKASDDNMWIGTSNLGILEYDFAANQFYQYFDSECGPCNAINTIIEDKNNVLWFGTYANLKKLTNQGFTAYDTISGLPKGEIKAIHQDIWGNIWVGTDNGKAVARYTNGQFESISLANGMEFNWVTSISSDNTGNVWFGLVGCGVVKFNGSLMQSYFESDGLPDNTIITILKDTKGCMWFGTYEGGLAKYTPEAL